MGCCGQGRAAFRARRDALAASSPPSEAVSGRSVRLEPVGETTLYALGAVTGKRYVFAPGKPLGEVDRRDLPVLLASGLFRPLD
jgi:hypothetical protein